MAKSCIECGKKKGVFEANYAGMDPAKEDNHPFPEKISSSPLPGNKKTDFLCEVCASKNEVKCMLHGVLKTDKPYRNGKPASCKRCKQIFHQLHETQFHGNMKDGIQPPKEEYKLLQLNTLFTYGNYEQGKYELALTDRNLLLCTGVNSKFHYNAHVIPLKNIDKVECQQDTFRISTSGEI